MDFCENQDNLNRKKKVWGEHKIQKLRKNPYMEWKGDKMHKWGCEGGGQCKVGLGWGERHDGPQPLTNANSLISHSLMRVQ